MAVTAEQVWAGSAVYTKLVLACYDAFVIRYSNRFVWRCPSKHLLAQYDRYATGNHLDVGVGTGFFLDHCRFPVEKPRVALMDLNPNCLHAAGTRIARYEPETYRANVLEPIRVDTEAFDSIGMNYLFHCLPGTAASKSVVFGHLKQLLKPGGVLFGSTLLQGGVRRNAMAKQLMAFYNARRVFTNEHDDLAGLKAGLDEHFAQVDIDVIGCAALFSARDPR